MAWNDTRDAFLTKLGIPTGINLSGGASAVPPEAASQAGNVAGNGIIALAEGAISNLFRPGAAAVAGSPQAHANTVAKISLPVLLIGGVAIYFLLRRKK